MSYRNAFAACWIVTTFGCAALAAAQSQSGASGARSAQPAPSAAAPSTPAQGPGVPAPVNQPAAPVDQPATSPPPSAPTPATQTQAPTTASQAAGPTPRTPPTPAAPPAQATPPNSQQTVMPNTPNSSTSTENVQRRNRARLATQDAVPPASRGAGMSNNRPNCAQMRGIEKAECERRDTSRDDLPAGVTTTQEPRQPTTTQSTSQPAPPR
jgi:hypothetical protein